MQTLSAKIEPRLAAEMQRAEETGQGNSRIPVLIQVTGAESLTPPNFADLERQVAVRQRSVRELLQDLGVQGEIRSLTLSNSLETSLTPAQIRNVAGHQDVKSILWNRAEQVVL